MALPKQLKTARVTSASAASGTPTTVADVETAIANALGYTMDSDITESALSLDNAGRITKQLTRHVAAAPVGIRLRDTTNTKEIRIAFNNTIITIDENTGTEGTPVWSNRATMPLSTGIWDGGGGGSSGALYSNVNDSAAISNTTVDTAFNKSVTLAAGSLIAGDVIRVSGHVRLVGIANATCKLNCKVDGTAFGTFWIPVNTYAAFSFQAFFVARTIGAVGVIKPGFALPTTSDTYPGGDPTATFTKDTTGTLAVQVFAEWNTANVGNSVVLHDLLVERVRPAATS